MKKILALGECEDDVWGYKNELPREGVGIVEFARPPVLIERVDALHILLRECEVHDFKILSKMIGFGTRDGDEIALDDPTEHHL